MSVLEEKNGAVILALQIQPKASRNEVVGIREDAVKIKLTAPPVEGAANKQCISFLSKVLGIPKTDIEIISGAKSRKKRLKIQGISRSSLEESLGL